VPIRTHNKFFAFAALLALLFSFSSYSFAGAYAPNNGHSSNQCFSTAEQACLSSTPPGPTYGANIFSGGSCRSTTNTGEPVGYILINSCSDVCSVGEARNEQGFCESPPPICISPKTIVNGVCICPPLGSGSTVVSVVTGPDDPWPGQVNHGGCKYELPTSGNPAVNENGDNCTVAQNGSLTCWYNATPTGEESEPCEANPAACLPVPDSAPTEPTPAKEPETSNETKSTTGGGSSTTTREKSTVVAPDGMVEDREVVTTTTTENGVTTTETTTTITVRQPDGSTTGTTSTTVTDGNGNTTITASGNTSTPGQGTGNSAEKKAEEEAKGAGDCDPTASNYHQCLSLLEQAPDQDGASILAGASTSATGYMDSTQGEILNAISSRPTPPEPNAIVSWIKSVMPSPSSCNSVGFSFYGHDFDIPCQKVEIIKDWFGWVLAIGTIIFCFQIALTPRAA
jgi:Predicted solute binding protein